MKKESIKQNYVYNLTYQILNLLLPLATTPYISKVLGPGNIGIYSYTYSFVSTFVMVGSLGIATYGQREIAGINDNKVEYSKKFWEIQLVKMLSISASLIFYVLFALFYRDYRFYFLIQIPYFLAAIFDVSWLFQGIEKFKYVALRNICVKILSLALIFLLVKTSEDLPIYIMLICASQLAGNATMWMHLRKYVLKCHVSPGDLIKHIRPTFIYFVPTISYQVHSVLDKAMLGVLYHDNVENGYYEQAHKIINMAMMIISSYNIVMRSRMTSLYVQGKKKEFETNFNNSLHFISLLVFPMSFGMAGVAANFVPWFFGPEYEKVVTLLLIFCPMFIIQGLRTCIGYNIITPTGMQTKGNIVQVVSAITNVALNSLVIPQFGAIGATAASVIAEGMALVGYLYYMRDYVRVIDVVKAAYKYWGASIIMFLVIDLLSSKFEANILDTFCLIIIGGAIYFVALFIFRDKFFIKKVKQYANWIPALGVGLVCVSTIGIAKGPLL